MNKPEDMPKHIGFIMDGNRRWAKLNDLSVNEGHFEGYKTILKIASQCRDRGIKIITIYAFSTENTKRERPEVSGIQGLFKKGIIDNISQFKKDGVRLNIIGRVNALPYAMRKLIENAEKITANGKDSIINVAFNYGGRTEIVDSIKKITDSGESVDEDTISRNLYTKDIPDPDLIIRTGGQKRLSNFMIWQAAYAELYFTDCLWPDFDNKELNKALKFYCFTKRNYGV